MSEQRSNFAISHICPTQPPTFYAVQATQKCSLGLLKTCSKSPSPKLPWVFRVTEMFCVRLLSSGFCWSTQAMGAVIQFNVVKQP